MPVIVQIPPDPPDLLIAGEQMRASALFSGIFVASTPNIFQELLSGALEPVAIASLDLVPGEISFSPMVGGYPVPNTEVLSQPFNGARLSANGVIATPCGALVPLDIGNHLMENFVGSSVLWSLTGITRDSAGAVLGNCAVDVLEVGRMTVDGEPVVAKTISDGSGNYSVPVPMNVAYQVLAYKTGSPDVTGATLNTLTPAAAG